MHVTHITLSLLLIMHITYIIIRARGQGVCYATCCLFDLKYPAVRFAIFVKERKIRGEKYMSQLIVMQGKTSRQPTTCTLFFGPYVHIVITVQFPQGGLHMLCIV